MASKNSIKPDVKDGYYHVYNRGVEKRSIFKDEQDHKVFLSYLKEYLSPVPKVSPEKTSFQVRGTIFKGIRRLPRNYNGKVILVAYCLMKNHFHFLIKQSESSGMKEFLHSLLLRYSVYFNKKYNRVGPLFQGRYKAILINDDPYLLHLSRYIHLNPSEVAGDLVNTYSSYGDYLKIRKTGWVNPAIVLDFFEKKTIPEITKVNTYKDFVEKYKNDPREILGDLSLD